MLAVLSCHGTVEMFHMVGRTPKEDYPCLYKAAASLDVSGERLPMSKPVSFSNVYLSVGEAVCGILFSSISLWAESFSNKHQ